MPFTRPQCGRLQADETGEHRPVRGSPRASEELPNAERKALAAGSLPLAQRGLTSCGSHPKGSQEEQRPDRSLAFSCESRSPELRGQEADRAVRLGAGPGVWLCPVPTDRDAS